ARDARHQLHREARDPPLLERPYCVTLRVGLQEPYEHGTRLQRAGLLARQRLDRQQYLRLLEHGGGRIGPFDPAVGRIRELGVRSGTSLEQHSRAALGQLLGHLRNQTHTSLARRALAERTYDYWHLRPSAGVLGVGC